MAKYLLSTNSVEGVVGDPMTDEETQQSRKQIGGDSFRGVQSRRRHDQG